MDLPRTKCHSSVGVRLVPVYVILGASIWYAFLKSGVHPTVAGVVIGLLTPASPWLAGRSLANVAEGVVERLRKDGYENLTVPTRSQLDKKVVFVTKPGLALLSDPVFGHGTWSSWCSWYNAPIWIEKPADWPRGGKGLMVVTGTLVEHCDVPAFKLDSDLAAPFHAGLPVPAGENVEDVGRRYIIVDVSWNLVNAPKPKQPEDP